MKFFIILTACVFFSFSTFAGTTGKLAGKVTNGSTGEALIGVNVIVVETATGAASNENGVFTVVNLPPGKYSVKASYIGFKSVIINNISISADQTTSLTIQLFEETLETEVVVIEASRPLIQKDVTGTQSVVDREVIDALPVQNFTDVLKLQGGVVSDGNTLHVRGGRGNEVAYLIDGIYISDPVSGRAATSVGNDAIEELKFLTGTFNAEYGNAMSGVVNIVTRDGTDQWGGSADFNTSEFGISDFSNQHLNYSSLSLSGPALPGKLYFFSTASVDNRGSWLPFGFSRSNNAMIKLTAPVLPGLKVGFSGRYADERRKSYNHDFKYIPDRWGQRFVKSTHLTATVTHSPLPQLFYDLKFSVFNRNYRYGLDKDTSEYAVIASFIRGPNGEEDFYSNYDDQYIERNETQTFSARADVFWQVNQYNELKFGGEYRVHKIDYFYLQNPTQQSNLYTSSFNRSPLEISGYIQDKIEFYFLVINLGLRLDFFDQNARLRTNPLDPASAKSSEPKYQLSPRMAIAHPISDRTLIRIAYGKFLQNPEYRYFYENSDYANLRRAREPSFGQPDLDAQRTTAYELGIVHQLTDLINFNLTAYYKDISGLIALRRYDAFTNGRPIGYYLYENESYGNVKGAEFNFQMSRIHGVSGEVTYSYSVAKGSSSSAENIINTKKVYFLNFDKTHTFNGYLNYVIAEQEGPSLFGFKPLERSSFTALFTGSTGFPYTPSGRDIGLADRNSERMPLTWQLDLEFAKKVDLDQFSLTIYGEILNVTDRKNVVNVYPDTGEPDLTFEGKHTEEWIKNPENYAAPRQMRLGLRFNF